MSYIKNNYLYVLNCIIPLFFGLFIYMTIKEETLISRSFSSLRSLMPIIEYPQIIRNFAADFLWAYSMFFCLRLTLGDELSGKYNVIVLLLTANSYSLLIFMALIGQ